MIPTFPEFKNISVDDREVVESHTHRYPPYSDFNFTSLWAWDTSNERMISELNGNLVVRFTDYATNEPFLSFLGVNKQDETTLTLLEYCVANGLPPHLKLMPEISVKEVDPQRFQIEEDQDNFDYIISLDSLRPHDEAGRKLSTRRKLIHKLKNLGDFIIKPVHIADTSVSSQILKLSMTWERQHAGEDSKHLHEAIKRMLTAGNTVETILALGAFLNDKLVGFSINEVLVNGYAIGHFQQADPHAPSGVYAYLMQEAAIQLGVLECQYINLEQDLGIQGLKRWKMSYNPECLLRKYIVSLVEKSI